MSRKQVYVVTNDTGDCIRISGSKKSAIEFIIQHGAEKDKRLTFYYDKMDYPLDRTLMNKRLNSAGYLMIFDTSSNYSLTVAKKYVY